MSIVNPHSLAAANETPVPSETTAALELQSFSYEPRAVVTSALSDELARCGCWMLLRKPVSLTQMEMRFELQLRSIVDLYAALLAAGLELTRGSHQSITGLCTLRKHDGCMGRDSASVVTVRLEVSFLDEVTVASVLTTGTAFA